MMNTSASNFATLPEEWHSRLCTRPFIFIDDELFINARFLTCQITKLPFFLNSVHIAMALNKNSPFGELFNRQLIRFRELGLLAFIKRKVLPQLMKETTATATGGDDNSFKSIEWQQTIPAFAIFCASSLLSLTLLVIELIYFHLKLQREKSNS